MMRLERFYLPGHLRVGNQKCSVHALVAQQLFDLWVVNVVNPANL